MDIVTNDLGLAAFMKMKGLRLISCIGRVFTFDGTDDSELQRALEIEYANSCCRQHDSNVVYLRSMVGPQSRIRS
jgi:uncharacterized protein YaiI (UPF0178 family)